MLTPHPSLELRMTLPAFFHTGIHVDSRGQLRFDKDALKALSEYIGPHIDLLKKREHQSHIKVGEVSEQVIAEVASNLENEGQLSRSQRLLKKFSLLARIDSEKKKKGKEKEKIKEAKKVIRKELSHFSYILPIEYLDTSINRQAFPIELIIWSDSTIQSVLECLQSKASILPALARKK